MSSAKWNLFSFFIVVLSLSGAGLSGCSNQTSDSGTAQANPTDLSQETNPIRVTVSDRVPTSVAAPSKLESETSPASSATAQPAPIDESDARQVCQRFLELLQSGNRIAAENLLTRSALTVTGKAQLVLQPLGGSDCRFEIGEPNYATIKNEVAYVECEIIEGVGRPEDRFSVTWLVKKQNSVWRISGLLEDQEENGRTKLLSFENPHDVEEIKVRMGDTPEIDASDE